MDVLPFFAEKYSKNRNNNKILGKKQRSECIVRGID